LTESGGSVQTEVRRIAGLAWPVILGQVGLVAMGTADMLMVGHLGAEPLAAIGIANTWSFAALIFGLGVCSGLDPFFSQAYGAGRLHEVGQALVRGGLLVTCLGFLLIGVHLAAGPGLTLLAQPAALIGDASSYCTIIAYSVPPFLGFALIKQLLQGSGRMKPAMWVIAMGNLANILANWIFIYGNLGFDAMGVPGAAASTVLVRWAMFTALLALGSAEIRRVWPWGIDLGNTQALSHVAFTALPVGLQLGLEVWAFNAATLMAGWLGSISVAAHTAALNIASLAFMVPLGLSAAATTRTGNLVGAGHPWARAAWISLGLSTVAAATSATLFTLAPHSLAHLYNPDPEVIGLIALVLPIAALFQGFDAGQVVSFGILRGLGDTRKPMIANVVGYWLIGLPAGYLLAFHGGMGLRGIWWGMTLSLAIVSGLLLARIGWHHYGLRRSSMPRISPRSRR
jgi:multidrug resistance protein, MATE family